MFKSRCDCCNLCIFLGGNILLKRFVLFCNIFQHFATLLPVRGKHFWRQIWRILGSRSPHCQSRCCSLRKLWLCAFSSLRCLSTGAWEAVFNTYQFSPRRRQVISKVVKKQMEKLRLSRGGLLSLNCLVTMIIMNSGSHLFESVDN